MTKKYLFLSLAASFAAALIEFFGRGKLAVIIPYAIIIPAVILAPRIVFHFSGRLRTYVLPEWAPRIEQLAFYIVFLNALASLWFHEIGFQYDRFLHFVAAFAWYFVAALVLSPVLRRFFENVSWQSVFKAAFLVMFAGLFLFEALQYLIDITFGARLFYDVVQPIEIDFAEDILFGFAGLLFAAAMAKMNPERFGKLAR